MSGDVLLERRRFILKNLSYAYLNLTTTAAILGAFGDDGKAVINATNAYLNGIATTDPTKATVLAAFINEDPMMVCSFGLQPQGVTMPIRWLVNNNSGKMYTGIIPQSDTGVRLLVKNTQSNYNGSIFSAGDESDRYAMYEQGRILIYWRYPGGYDSTGIEFATPRRVEYNIDSKLRVTDLQDIQLFQTNLNQRNCSDELMIGWKYISSPNGNNAYGLFEVVDGNNSIIGKFAPFNDNGTIKCVDIHNARLVTIEGTFTDTYTLQDGVTPWTPANQTP